MHALAVEPIDTVAPLPAPQWRRREDAVLMEVMQGYRRRGGFASGEELVQIMRPSWRQPISVLARWIVSRQVLTFTWRSQILLPLFQFEEPRMRPLDGVVAVTTELKDVFDELELAEWFVKPNAWLGDDTPVDRVIADPLAVLEAARADRFIARGC